MAIFVEELTNSRSSKAASDAREDYSRSYLVYGETASTIAAALAFNEAPNTVYSALTGNLLYKVDGYGNPHNVTTSLKAGAHGDCYEVTINYLDPVKADAQRQLRGGEFRITKSTQGGTLHITQSKETIERYTSPTEPLAAPDFGKAIGVTRAGEIHGVDIHTPVAKTTVEFRFEPGVINMAYLAMLDEMVATVNDAWFLCGDTGTTLFAGYTATNAVANGQVTGPQISFDFLHQPNREDFLVGDTHVNLKEGWHYLWCYYKERKAKDQGGGDVPIIVKYPSFVYVERVYEYSDFEQFGFGNMSVDPNDWEV